MNDEKNDIIELTLPINAAYVSAARLTASSVSNRLGFDIDEIEDIKAAVSEACTYVVKYYSSKKEKNFCIKLNISEKQIDISLSVDAATKLSQDEDDMGLCMIKALVDNFELDFNENDHLKISMLKKHNTSSFN
ncbi:MAG: ATP-binding protein [Firmicutes bacterium]|nr:ATP-binding protein [Bacillota bacterium]